LAGRAVDDAGYITSPHLLWRKREMVERERERELGTWVASALGSSDRCASCLFCLASNSAGVHGGFKNAANFSEFHRNSVDSAGPNSELGGCWNSNLKFQKNNIKYRKIM
jgi:hypothetical protein